MQQGDVIRQTQAMCPECLRDLPAQVVVRGGKVLLARTCPDHGVKEALISDHPDYHAPLDRFYFKVMNRPLPQRDYIVRLTDRCNLNCPICLAGANEAPTPDYTRDQLAKYLKGRKRNKVDLMGAEPTVREDLPDLIRMVEESGNISALHTNGIRLADMAYLKTLKDAGLREVHLQFDGFDDRVYEALRGKPLLQEKLRCLANLEETGIATDIVMVVARGLNEAEIGPVLRYGLEKDFVREVFFLGCRFLGRARGAEWMRQCLMPDEVIDIVEEQSRPVCGGSLSRKRIFRFQKLYFALLSLLGVKKCLYIQHFLFVRTGKDFLPIDEVVDLEKLEPALDLYAERMSAGDRLGAAAALSLRSLPSFANARATRLFPKLALMKLLLWLGFDLSRLPRDFLLIGYISACDPLMYDAQVAEYCGKGELSNDLGDQDLGAFANVSRERRRLRMCTDSPGLPVPGPPEGGPGTGRPTACGEARS